MGFANIEKKWQKRWEEKKTFEVKENLKKKKYYVLEMFPYPSGSGLHMGHAFNYTVGDIYARYMRMKGFNVLYPMGFDSFGLPAENTAIKEGIHPKKYTESAIKNYIRQMKNLGLSYDWSKTLRTSSPEYYKWNQYFFLKFLENGLVYRKKGNVNWCSQCKTVLANEQVHNGKCWRHGNIEVETKQLEQWFIKTTKYAEELLRDIEKLDWPERIKAMQRNWIGRSEGTEIIFDVNGKCWKVFTTRPDTLFGVTFMVVSAQHPELMSLVTEKQKKEVEKFLKKIKSTKQKDLDKLDKEGVFTGSYAVHPLTNEKIQIWAGNFVVADYGSGMVMAVPAHDERDFAFAKKYNLPIKRVIEPTENRIIAIGKSLNKESLNKLRNAYNCSIKEGLVYIYTDKIKEVFELAKNNFVGSPWYLHSEGSIKNILFHSDKEEKIFDWQRELKKAKEYGAKIGIKKEQLDFDEVYEAFTDFGVLVNSEGFNGLKSSEAREHITNALRMKKLGGKTVQYKLRDWLVSRQRYWGTPIPVIYCEKCGIVPVPEKELPIKLPDNVKFGKGNPLKTNEKFVNVKCCKCGGKAERETDTIDTFFDSSWYFLRYLDSENSRRPFEFDKVKYWMPVDQYIGGAEHAVMHLIYARFFVKALRDLGFVKFNEPFMKLFNQGMLHKDGSVMSKSKGNVVLPETVSEKYGIDTARLFLVSIASPDKDIEWSDSGIEGAWRFVNKIMNLITRLKIGKTSARMAHRINRAIKIIGDDIESFRYNFAVIKLRELFDSVENEISRKDLESCLKLLTPFCPHMAEELWSEFGGKSFVSLSDWPLCDESKINEKFDKAEAGVAKIVSDILNVLRIVGKGDKVYVYVLPSEAEFYSSDEISSRVGKEVKIFAVNDKRKYDPHGKASKARAGKPAIYVE